MTTVFQSENGIERVVVHVGDRTDSYGNPSKRAIEHINTILASLSEFSNLPQIRLYWDPEVKTILIGGLKEDSPRGRFCSDYCKICIIERKENLPYGFTLNFA